MSDSSPSRLGENVDAALAEKIASAKSSYEITEILHNAAIARGLVTRDIDPLILNEVNVPVPKSYAKTLNINGIKHVVEAATEEGLQQAELSLMREIFGGQSQEQRHEQQQEQQPKFSNVVYDPIAGRYRNGDGQFLSDEVAAQLIQQIQRDTSDLTRQSELEMKFKRGEIDSATYIRESGVLDQVLDQREQQSWADATGEFLNSDYGQNWMGGEAGVTVMSRKLEELGLTEASDKFSALVTAWQAIQSEQAEIEQEKTDEAYKLALSACTTHEQIDAVTARFFQGRTAHSMSPDELREHGFWGK
jgi:hypothetical protein